MDKMPARGEPSRTSARLTGWLSSLGSQVVGAFVTTVALSIGFMIFSDYIAPAPELAGRWKFTVVYKDTAYDKFNELRVTYQVLLFQDGLDLSGNGEKMSDRGPTQDPVDYDGDRRTPLRIAGTITRNYFSADAVTLHYMEEGRRRESFSLHRLPYVDSHTMCGCFHTTVANSSGTVSWRRASNREELYEPVDQPARCAELAQTDRTCTYGHLEARNASTPAVGVSPRDW